MGKLSKDTFAGVTYAVMGMGTEGGRTPYQITVAAQGGWNGTPIAASGYSVGAMQFDFGQRSGSESKPSIDPSIHRIRSGSVWLSAATALIEQFVMAQAVVAILALTVCTMFSTAARAKGVPLNPAQLGTFCPPGSELADDKHTDVLSRKEQAQIKRTALGFMALDASARRGGNPLGISDYWESGYTLRFDQNDAPSDWVQYLAARISNTCSSRESAFAVILLDVAISGPSEVTRLWPKARASSQQYWDAFTRTQLKIASEIDAVVPKQPVVFTTIPFARGADGMWRVVQRNVSNLIKFRKSDWQRRIDQTNLFSCSHPKTSPQYSADRCEQMEKDKQTLKQLSRPAWSVAPKDYRATTSHR